MKVTNRDLVMKFVYLILAMICGGLGKSAYDRTTDVAYELRNLSERASQV